MSHWEIVRSDAPKPWHARLIANGNVVLTTPQHSPMVGVERAILTDLRHARGEYCLLKWNVVGVEKVVVSPSAGVLGSTVTYRDERVKP